MGVWITVLVLVVVPLSVYIKTIDPLSEKLEDVYWGVLILILILTLVFIIIGS